MPIKIAWRQLIVAVVKIVKVQVAVACKGFNFKCLNIGTKKIPPPKPKPLNIPAQKLFYNIYILLSSITFAFYISKSYSPKVI